jgi:hypothetical protein
MVDDVNMCDVNLTRTARMLVIAAETSNVRYSQLSGEVACG